MNRAEDGNGAGADGEREPAGLLSTWVEVMFRPGRFFARPAGRRSTVGPVVFAIGVSAVGAVGGVVVESLMGRRAEDGGGGLSGALIGAPIQTLIGLYVMAGLLHGMVKIFGGGRAVAAGAATGGAAEPGENAKKTKKARGTKKGSAEAGDRVFDPPAEGAHKGGGTGPFSETVQCVGYAYAPALLGVLGFVGAGVGGIWWLVILTVGLTRVHRTRGPLVVMAAVAIPAVPVLLALGLRAGVVEAFKIPSGGMLPTLAVGDHLFVSKLAYGPQVPGTKTRVWSSLPPRRGDVMVFRFPENEAQDFVNRAVALPGDTLEVVDGRPVLNGWVVPHCLVGKTRLEGRDASVYVEHLGELSYLTMFEEAPDDRPCKESEDCGGEAVCKAGVCGSRIQGPWRVAAGEVWVMGDNRNNSHDSRSWRGGQGGGVPFDHIKGRASMVWMSFGPKGEVVSERIFLDVMGRPELPGSSDAALRRGLEECLNKRPPVEKTTPPAR